MDVGAAHCRLFLPAFDFSRIPNILIIIRTSSLERISIINFS